MADGQIELADQAARAEGGQRFAKLDKLRFGSRRSFLSLVMTSARECQQAARAVLLKAPQPFADGGHGGSEESRGGFDAALFGALDEPQPMVVGVIGILAGGGDVPGLNPAIRGVTLRALREGHQVIGIRHGWAGLVDIVREKDYDNSDNFFLLDDETVDRAGRTGGTFLHSSRTNPGRVAKSSVPAHLKDKFTAEKNDLTPEVLKNLDWLGIDTLIPIGGDDTLSYGVRLHKERSEEHTSEL